MVLLIVGKFFIYKCAYLQNSNRLMYLKKKLMVTRGGGGRGEGIDWEFGIDMSILLYLKYITNKGLL